MFEGMGAIEFAKAFPDNESCYRYLVELKWGNGYTCRLCGCTESVKGRTYYYKRCKACKWDESVTSHTVFHKLKVPILKAFYMAFRISTKKKGMSTVELGTELKIRQKTAWLLKRKLQLAMQTENNKKKLKGEVIADETLIGGGRKGSYGRKHDDKDILFVAVEKLPGDKTGNIALRHIEDFSVGSIFPAMKDVLEEEAKVNADSFTTYKAIEKKRPNTVIVKAKGSSFYIELHKQIMMFKMWLTGIHHKCSEQHLSAYAAEYEFRFNRRNQRKWIFHNLLSAVFNTKPHSYSQLMNLCELKA